MTNRVVLDTGPLGRLVNPKWNRDAVDWFRSMAALGYEVIIPEIADYEVRRKMIHTGQSKGIRRLNQLKDWLEYIPITTEAMLDAASMWAEARRRGKSTAAPKALDGDVILAAQTKIADAIVATDNIKHLDQFVETVDWRDMGFSPNDEKRAE